MPIPILNNDIIEVKLYCQLAEQIGINVLHYRAENKIGNGGNLEDVGNTFTNVLNAPLPAILAGAALFRGVGARRVFPGLGSLEYFSSPGSIAGGATGDPLPRQTAAILTKITAVAGSKGRGRVYLPFPAEGDNTTAAVPSAGYITRCQTVAAVILATRTIGTLGNTTDLRLSVWRRGFAASIPVDSLIARNRWGTQRRRGSYGQANLPPI